MTFWIGDDLWWLEDYRKGNPVPVDDGRGVVVLRYEWLDLELNVEEHNLYYFCCYRGLRFGDPEWASYDELDDEPEVDLMADDWTQQLFADMIVKLARFAERYNLKYDEPNWVRK